MTVYNLLKFLHVAGVTVWVGGVVSLAVLNTIVARGGDARAVAAMARASAFYGQRVIGPAVGVVLLAGVAMVGLYRIHFTAFWVVCGLVGLFGSALMSALAAGRTGSELSRIAFAEPRDESRIGVLQRRLRFVTAANLLVLFSVILAMVYKPTL